MRYVVILIIGVLIGAGATVYLLGIGPARKAPGVAVKPPENGQNPPATVVIGLDQSFVDAVLATTFSGVGTPTFKLSEAAPSGKDRITTAAFQSGCTNSITLLPEGSGVKTGVQFRNGTVSAPLAFTGSYSLAGQCMQFKGWAQTNIKLYFEEPKQTVYGNVTVEGVNLEGVNPIANEFVSDKQLQLMIPVKASNGAVKAHAKDVRAEILDGSLKLHLTYEFTGVRGGPTAGGSVLSLRTGCWAGRRV